MRMGFVSATPCNVATIGASVVQICHLGSAAWDITLTNVSGLKAASCRSDAIADMSGGSMVSMNGIPTICNAAPASLRAIEPNVLDQGGFGAIDTILYPTQRDDRRCDLRILVRYVVHIFNRLDLQLFNAVLYPVQCDDG